MLSGGFSRWEDSSKEGMQGCPQGCSHFSPLSSPYTPAGSTKTAGVGGPKQPRVGLQKQRSGTKGEGARPWGDLDPLRSYSPVPRATGQREAFAR